MTLKATPKTQASSKTSPKVTRKTRSKINNGRNTLKNETDYAPKETTWSELYENDKCGVPNNTIKYVSWTQETVSCAVEQESRRAMMNKR